MRGQHTHKRLYNQITESEIFSLKPDNPNYEPYEIHASEVLELWKFTSSTNTQE